MHTTQTAFRDGVTPDFLKQMPDIKLDVSESPTTGALVVDRTTKFQEIFGFGGAFTEAAAHNWRRLSEEDQARVIQLYFADPKDNGHGYTMGRVPMGSCDFTVASYNFNNVSGDVDMVHFDKSVAHDEDSGMLPMIRAAQEKVRKRNQKLNVLASPWSPPAWMKNRDVNGKQSMTGSAIPLGLNITHQRAWANYFSAFVDAYKGRDVDLWGVTVQNEPEFAAGWEACVYTPEYESSFVRDHLGPVLRKDHPSLKIIGFDHNKDHVTKWAKTLYADNVTSQYLDGLGVHWYGGLNAENMNATHHIAPDKFILPTESCNCGGVVFRNESASWWSRAEKLAIDTLVDLQSWSVGYVDWNLVLDITGGPNHLGNMCDAHMIADPSKTVQGEALILQASYYYMGHFSRFIPPGSRRIELANTVQIPDLAPSVILGNMLRLNPCTEGKLTTWSYDRTSLALSQYGLCAEVITNGIGIVMKKCTGESAQQWILEDISGGQRIRSANFTNRCIMSKKVSGPVVGLDPGVDVVAGLAEVCGEAGVDKEETQTFQLAASGSQSFPEGFQVKTSGGVCLLTVGADTITFDAVAFETPSGDISIVAMNMGEADLSFEIYDATSRSGAKNVVVPRHAIASFTLSEDKTEVLLM